METYVHKRALFSLLNIFYTEKYLIKHDKLKVCFPLCAVSMEIWQVYMNSAKRRNILKITKLGQSVRLSMTRSEYECPRSSRQNMKSSQKEQGLDRNTNEDNYKLCLFNTYKLVT